MSRHESPLDKPGDGASAESQRESKSGRQKRVRGPGQTLARQRQVAERWSADPVLAG